MNITAEVANTLSFLEVPYTFTVECDHGSEISECLVKLTNDQGETASLLLFNIEKLDLLDVRAQIMLAVLKLRYNHIAPAETGETATLYDGIHLLGYHLSHGVD